MIDSPQLILAIESAIAGGSISLLSGGKEIANWIGTSSVSKAEELLVNIDEMLTTNGVKKQDLGLIAVSAGPGSFTGIRIGIATALGLKAGLGIQMSSGSALMAMASIQPDNAKITAVIPMGRDAVCVQTFRKNADNSAGAIDEPRTMSEDGLVSLVQLESETTFVLHELLYKKSEACSNVINFGSNIAYAVGAICRKYQSAVTEPIFVSKSF